MYKRAALILKDGVIHVFALGTQKGWPLMVSERVASLPESAPPGELAVATRQAIDKCGEPVTTEELRARAQSLEIATGEMMNTGRVTVGREDTGGRAQYLLTPDKVRGKTAYPVTEDEKRIDAESTDAELGAGILAMLKHGLAMNTRAGGGVRNTRTG